MQSAKALISIALFILFFACRSGRDREKAAGIMMQMEPVQCLGNPWEQDWLQAEGRKYEDYPLGNPRVLEEAEKEIIRSFFEKEGIRLYKLEGIPFPDSLMLCDACECPRGYTLVIEAAPADTARLRSFGFSMKKELEDGK